MSNSPIDQHIGLRLKLKRSNAGLSQNKLGEMTGVTFQQIQKYEKGQNRIGSSRLFEFAKILNVPITYFFEGITDSTMSKDSEGGIMAVFSDNDGNSSYGTKEDIGDRELSTLLKYYTRIKDKNIRMSILDLAKSLSKTGDSKEEDIKDLD